MWTEWLQGSKTGIFDGAPLGGGPSTSVGAQADGAQAQGVPRPQLVASSPHRSLVLGLPASLC